MAKPFNLTVAVNLQGPNNLKPIVSKIKKEIGSIKTTIDLDIKSASVKNLAAVTSKLKELSSVAVSTNASVSALNTRINTLASSFGTLAGSTGTAIPAMNKVSSSVGKAKKNISDTTTAIEEFGKQSGLAIKRFLAFSTVSSVIYGLSNAVNAGYKEFINFDKEIVRLSQVTGQSTKQLGGVTKEITRLSTTLGVASSDLLNVSTTLAQAGFSATETKVALEALAKSSLAPSFENITDTTEGAIAAMRQFGIAADELDSALGSINAVAAKFAVEAGDIITAIQRTGGVFANASKGVSEGTDALNEFIAVFTSVRATTRESAETIATGLRTIFTRIQRGKTIDELKKLGIELRDVEGKFVGPYEATRRLAEGLNRIDPRSAAFAKISEELGGFRQIGKVIPLIQQFAVAQDALKTAQKGSGSLAKDAITAQQSLAVQFTKTRESFLALIRDIGNSGSFRALVDITLKLTNGLISLAGTLKPLLPLLLTLGAIKLGGVASQYLTGFGKAFGGGGPTPPTTPTGPSGSGGGSGGGSTELGKNTSALSVLTTAINNLITRLGSGPIPKFARGGVVPGSGSGDTVPAMLEPGEFVIRKKAVETLGAGNLHRMNKYAEGGSVKINRIIDGDTIAGSLYTEKSFRLKDVDAAELNQKYGTQAKNFLEQFNKNDLAQRIVPGSGGYGRGLFADDNIANQLILNGYGVPDRRYAGDRYQNTVNEAIKSRRGIWNSLNTNHPKRLQFKDQFGYNNGGIIQKFLEGGTAQEIASTSGKNIEDVVLGFVKDLGGIDGVKGYLGLQKGDRELNSLLRKGNISKNLERVTSLIDQARQAAEDQGTLKANAMAAAQQLAIVGFDPIGYSGSIFEKLSNTDSTINIRGILSDYAEETQAILNSVSGTINTGARRLQSKAIFGGNKNLVFDFDDTLVSGADIYKPGTNEIDIPGYSDLNKVAAGLANGQLTELGQALKSILASNPEILEQIRILTARPQSNAPLLANKLQDLGLNIPASKITGVSGSRNKPQNLGSNEKLIDDLYATVAAVRKGGGEAFPYSPLKNLTAQEEYVSNIAAAQGSVLQAIMGVLGARGGSIQNEDVDFKGGLGPQAASFFGIDPNIPTEVKRTISSDSIYKAKQEFTNWFASNGMASGGSVQDTVPAMLTPGEFVINKESAKAIGYSKLNKLNRADKIAGFNRGGSVGIQHFAEGGGAESINYGDKSIEELIKIIKDNNDQIKELNQSIVGLSIKEKQLLDQQEKLIDKRDAAGSKKDRDSLQEQINRKQAEIDKIAAERESSAKNIEKLNTNTSEATTTKAKKENSNADIKLAVFSAAITAATSGITGFIETTQLGQSIIGQGLLGAITGFTSGLTLASTSIAILDQNNIQLSTGAKNAFKAFSVLSAGIGGLVDSIATKGLEIEQLKIDKSLSQFNTALETTRTSSSPEDTKIAQENLSRAFNSLTVSVTESSVSFYASLKGLSDVILTTSSLLISGITTVSTVLGSLSTAFPAFGTALSATGTALAGFVTGISAVALPIIAILAILGGAYYLDYKSRKEAAKQMDNLNQATVEASRSLSEFNVGNREFTSKTLSMFDKLNKSQDINETTKKTALSQTGAINGIATGLGTQFNFNELNTPLLARIRSLSAKALNEKELDPSTTLEDLANRLGVGFQAIVDSAKKGLDDFEAIKLEYERLPATSKFEALSPEDQAKFGSRMNLSGGLLGFSPTREFMEKAVKEERNRNQKLDLEAKRAKNASKEVANSVIALANVLTLFNAKISAISEDIKLSATNLDQSLSLIGGEGKVFANQQIQKDINVLSNPLGFAQRDFNEALNNTINGLFQSTFESNQENSTNKFLESLRQNAENVKTFGDNIPNILATVQKRQEAGLPAGSGEIRAAIEQAGLKIPGINEQEQGNILDKLVQAIVTKVGEGQPIDSTVLGELNADIKKIIDTAGKEALDSIINLRKTQLELEQAIADSINKAIELTSKAGDLRIEASKSAMEFINARQTALGKEVSLADQLKPFELELGQLVRSAGGTDTSVAGIIGLRAQLMKAREDIPALKTGGSESDKKANEDRNKALKLNGDKLNAMNKALALVANSNDKVKIALEAATKAQKDAIDANTIFEDVMFGTQDPTRAAELATMMSSIEAALSGTANMQQLKIASTTGRQFLQQGGALTKDRLDQLNDAIALGLTRQLGPMGQKILPQISTNEKINPKIGTPLTAAEEANKELIAAKQAQAVILGEQGVAVASHTEELVTKFQVISASLKQIIEDLEKTPKGMKTMEEAKAQKAVEDETARIRFQKQREARSALAAQFVERVSSGYANSSRPGAVTPYKPPVAINPNKITNYEDFITRVSSGSFMPSLGVGSQRVTLNKNNQFEAYPRNQGFLGFGAETEEQFQKRVKDTANIVKELNDALEAYRKSLLPEDQSVNKPTDTGFSTRNPAYGMTSEFATGGIVYRAFGGSIFKPRGTDTVPAMLTPGEFVVNRKATQQNLSLLQAINNGGIPAPAALSGGGVIYAARGIRGRGGMGPSANYGGASALIGGLDNLVKSLSTLFPALNAPVDKFSNSVNKLIDGLKSFNDNGGIKGPNIPERVMVEVNFGENLTIDAANTNGADLLNKIGIIVNEAVEKRIEVLKNTGK